MPHSEKYLATKYRHEDERGRYRLSDITGSGVRHGESGEVWRGFDVTAKGRHWMHTPAELDRLDEEGRIYWPPKGGFPAYKRYLSEGGGRPLQDVWTDIEPINSMALERLGYPTQKPEVLLERILRASSDEGDTVLDPFCGCGTTVAVAQRLKRRWIGIDITHLAINLIRHRLQDAYGQEVASTYEVIGEPVSVDDAEELAGTDPYQFQWWALGLVGARPVEQKKGADKGIDGRIYFHDEPGGKTKQIILSVKAGKTGPAHVNELRGVVEREDADIGALITFQEPTKAMKEDAASAGFYKSPTWHTEHPRIQLVTVAELLDGKELSYPHVTGTTFRKAPKADVETGDEALKLDI
jgi:hypothetical protein